MVIVELVLHLVPSENSFYSRRIYSENVHVAYTQDAALSFINAGED